MKNNSKKRNTKPYIFQVSTKPNIDSYKWAGRELSLLSTAMLWTVWFCRVLSLYQHIKAIYRILGEKLGWGFTDNKSGRPNIPPMMGEIYYLLWTAFFAIAHVLELEGPVVWGLTVYYLFESSVWILYYTIFRRFFEVGYSIYHQLEYLTMIVLIIPTQALCFAHLYDRRFREMLSGLMGASLDTTPFPVTLLGCLFAAIVVSMIISAFPVETVKKGHKKPKMFVVGSGDVVEERVKPAIEGSGSAKELKIYDLTSAQHKKEDCEYRESTEEICKAIDAQLETNSIVWVETPPYAHIPYVKHFIDSKAKLIVLEKPISVDREELQYVEKLIENDDRRNKLFFLSYYVLEKALPLYYLANHNEKYERYLNLEDKSLVDNWRLLLGSLKSVNVHICEGKDSRAWVVSEKYGGHLLETFLHNVLLAALFCGQPAEWTVEDYQKADYTNPIHAISLTARSRGTRIDLSMKKNAADRELKRKAVLEFEHGMVEADFDTKTARIYFATLDKYSTLSVKRNFMEKYSILVDLVTRVHEGECLSSEIDGLTKQIPVLKWLMQLDEKGTAEISDTEA